MSERVGELPSGYELEGDPTRGWCAVRTDVAERLRGAGFGLGSDGRVRDTDLSGRGQLVELEIDQLAEPEAALGAGELPLVPLLRRHRRGGLAARLGLDRFKDPARPFDELRLSERLRALGIATPTVLAARATRRGHGFDLALVTARVHGAVDLAEAWNTVDDAARHGLTRAAGHFVRTLFEVGLDHRDLHPKNLLVKTRDAGAQLWIVDLDRCALRPHLPEPRRQAALARFLRWCLRRPAAMPITRTDRLRFLVAARPAGDDWRSTWRALDRATRRRMLL
ncbi:3-deoxy-D-manno-octulosonic acid kinase [Planctomycetes bacterium Pla163]|uniref:3-deoxy-D-manno-octulosonic acid kinase n=1 Tax=Rohdeia mirabilis TaxID=2528008 RepID=A0A518CZD6_9BACT|nr:3-deoxy-D-manno-octulosonic acid kinase [Planctomycetes bacterium Pla163]